jgi:hypothetical protein
MNERDIEELKRFDQGFTAENPFRRNVDSLPNGTYQCEIVDASLDRTENSQELIFRMLLRINGGGLFEWPHWPKDLAAANRIGAVMVDLGFGKFFPPGRFSTGIISVLSRLRGLKFQAHKTTRLKDRNQPQGDVYHDFIVLGLITGAVAAGTAPPSSSPGRSEVVATTPSAVLNHVPQGTTYGSAREPAPETHRASRVATNEELMAPSPPTEEEEDSEIPF